VIDKRVNVWSTEVEDLEELGRVWWWRTWSLKSLCRVGFGDVITIVCVAVFV